MTQNERRIVESLYENELRKREDVTSVIDFDDRVVLATTIASNELRARKGWQRCYIDIREPGKLTKKWLSLRKYVRKLFIEDKRYNGFQALTPEQVAEAMEAAKTSITHEPPRYSKTFAEELEEAKTSAEKAVLREEFELAVERETLK